MSKGRFMNVIQKSITDAPDPFIVHGVNLRGKYNKGVAKAVRTLWPSAYDEYIRVFEKSKLGDYNIVKITPTLSIVNLFSQNTYGNYGIHANLEAIITGLWNFLQETKPSSIAIPPIGCGYGGLDWKDVSEAFTELENATGTTFNVYLGEK